MNYKQQVERYCEVNGIDEGEMYQILLKIKIYTIESRGKWIDLFEELELSSLFVWWKTPEGRDYWANINDGFKVE